jgi:chemotaxis signal transduction protein
MSVHEETGGPRRSDETGEACELLLLRAGGQLFAVRAEEADGAAQACPRPTPLPRAPRAVLGVVALRGRMRTVLDPSALVNAQAVQDSARTEADAARLETDLIESDGATARVEEARPLVLALRGDEQLALAVERVEGIIEVPDEALAQTPRPAPPLRAVLEHEGARLLILDPSRLFDAAMRGTERRRPRT